MIARHSFTRPFCLSLLTAVLLAVYSTTPWTGKVLGAIKFSVTVTVGLWSCLTGLSWMTKEFGDRLMQLQEARVYPAVAMAAAIKGLTIEQAHLITDGDMRGAMAWVTLQDPPLIVTPEGGHVPWAAMKELISRTCEDNSYPYLAPIRYATNKDYAAACVRTLIAIGWAIYPSARNQSAKLTVPLEVLADRYCVDLDEVKEFSNERKTPATSLGG